MNKETIFQEIKSILVNLFEIEPELITLEANLYKDLDIDSIDAVDLAIEVRDLVNKPIDPQDFKQVRTVGDLVETAEKLLQQ